MDLNICFLHHGEAAASRTGVYCGTLDQELTAEGRHMAQDFATAYQFLPCTAFYSSPLRRAVATAEPLCKAVRIQMQCKEGLREIGYGNGKEKPPMRSTVNSMTRMSAGWPIRGGAHPAEVKEESI